MRNIFINLRLFDGGAGAAAPGDGGAGNQGGTQASPAATRRGTSGEYQNVKFGKQDAPAAAGAKQTEQQTPAAGEKRGVESTSDALEEKRRAFRALVDGEYKDIYTQETQQMINRRFRETKNLEQQVSRQQPLIDMLMQRYKITDGDLDKLGKAVENDDAYWSEAAEEAGMSVEQYKQFQRLQRENTQLRNEQMRSQNQRAAQQKLQQWFQEGETVKAIYPEFDLSVEAQDPQFLSLLRAGVPVKLAYEARHMDDIKSGVAKSAAKATEKQVVDGIRARGTRPVENGTSAQSGFIVKDDPSKWTKKDRAEIARRVQKGEQIKL